MPFGIGGHPGFNVPLEQGTDFSDYYIEFSEKAPARRWVLTDTGFMTGETQPFALENGKIYRLHHDMFDHDAIFLRDIAPSFTLKSDKTTKAITVSYTNMPYLGFWHKPCTKAPYMCIEPWNGLPASVDESGNLWYNYSKHSKYLKTVTKTSSIITSSKRTRGGGKRV